VIDGLTALGIEYEVAAQWAEVAQGETAEDRIKDALRRRALALEIPKDAPDEPGPDTVGDTEEPETVTLEVCSEPSKPQSMTGADVFVPESLLQYRENIEKRIVDEEVGKVAIKDHSGLPRIVRLEMLIGLLADQLAVTLDSVKQLKIACNASCQTKGALEHLIHLAHLSWEPLDRIASHIHFYVAPDEPKGEDPEYMI
jgi:hypothetical protein